MNNTVYKGAYIDECAAEAVVHIISNLSDYENRNKCFSKEDLLKWGSMRPLEELTDKASVNNWDLAVLRFTEAVRGELLEKHKRYMTTLHGVGFELVSSAEQAVHAEKRLRARVHKALNKAENIQRNTDTSAFSSVQKDIHRQANQRVAVIAAALENQKRMDRLAGDEYPVNEERSQTLPPHLRKNQAKSN